MCVAVLSLKFQSTPPRGERRFAGSFRQLLQYISIHAPTWGATLQHFSPTGTRRISIHAPTWGATVETRLQRIKPKFQSTPPRGERLFTLSSFIKGLSYFNPRPHVGSDLAKIIFIAVSEISIHAPTWGATSIFAKKFSSLSAKIV